MRSQARTRHGPVDPGPRTPPDLTLATIEMTASEINSPGHEFGIPTVVRGREKTKGSLIN